MDKTLPNIGDKLYLRQFTGNCWVDMVKRPYTVISVHNDKVVVQSCKLIFPVFHYDESKMSEYYKRFDGKRPQFFDSMPESIEEDKYGDVEILTWHPKRGMWGTKGRDEDYPKYAIFGAWAYAPYLD